MKGCRMTMNSALSVLAGTGSEQSMANSSSNSLPLWISSVAYDSQASEP